jgi:uncharacterized protein YlzI (FlbEa/FlbD family)
MKYFFLFAWIVLTTPSTNDPIYVNVETIEAIHRTFNSISNGNSIVFLSSGNNIYVKETTDEVWDKIKKIKHIK